MAFSNSKPPVLKNQYLVVFILSKLTQQVANCGIYPFNNPGDQPKYPFFTYQMINAGQYTTADHRSDQMDITLQIDAHASDQFQSSQMANDLREALYNDSSYRSFFTQADIVPYEPDISANIQDHTTAIFGTNYDYMFGFDMSFQISNVGTVYEDKELNFNHDNYDIRSVRATDSINDDHIDANKKGEN